MNAAFRKHLTAAEVELIELTKADALRAMDEDELGDLHQRVRRASRKYRVLHRRQAAAQVSTDRSRAKASTKNQRTAVKAEVFEDALSRVSTALAKAARASAAELKAERLEAARRETTAPSAPTRARGKAAGERPRGKGRAASTRTPASTKRTASTRATGARRQAKRDSR